MSLNYPHLVAGGSSEPSSALSTLSAFLSASGEGLAVLLDALDDAWAIREIAAARAIAGGSAPETDRLRGYAREIADYLAEIPVRRLTSAAARYPGRDLDAALRWYGARLSELVSLAD